MGPYLVSYPSLGGQQSWAATAIAKSHQNSWKIARASTFNPCNHKNGGFLKGGYPQIIQIRPWLSIETHGDLGIPHFRKPSRFYDWIWHMHPRLEAPRKKKQDVPLPSTMGRSKRSRGQNRHGTKLHGLQGLTEGLICLICLRTICAEQVVSKPLKMVNGAMAQHVRTGGISCLWAEGTQGVGWVPASLMPCRFFLVINRSCILCLWCRWYRTVWCLVSLSMIKACLCFGVCWASLVDFATATTCYNSLAVQSNIEQHTKTKITQTQDWVNNGRHAIKHRQKSHDHHLICNYAVKNNTVKLCPQSLVYG